MCCAAACLYLSACLFLKRNWARLSPYGPPPELADSRLARIDQKYHNGTLQVQTKDRKPGKLPEYVFGFADFQFRVFFKF